MPDGFTHKFKIYLGDGSQWLEGKIEFNTDGKMTYHIQDTCTPMKKETLDEFNNLMDKFHSLFHKFGGIKKIEIKIIES